MENENIVVEHATQTEQFTAKKKRDNKKRQRRKLGWLFTLTGITALVLIVETYAWFIGTGSINTSEFEIGVSTEESLFLSLDGSHWATSLKITKANVLADPEGQSAGLDGDHYAYQGHTNSWVEDGVGLVPISTYGEIDPEVSRLKLFGKSSITATKGGFRLISTRIDNYSEDEEGIVNEQGGYVAFDLFVMNGEGTDYLPAYHEEDDEAIYLTTNSAVSVVKEGAGTESDYGLANSVRIAFAQIGRMASNGHDKGDATEISCASTVQEGEAYQSGQITGLCSKTKTTIWEPNDKLHDAELIEYFERVCKGKSTDAEGKITYGADNSTCITLTETTEDPIDTYVVKEDIASDDNVDVYDGINGFEIPESYPLAIYDNTFTDTDKMLENENRPAFFKLAANSITKIRVYIYLEGQDVDNYDLISLGKKVKINFGFTKDQFDLQGNEGYVEPEGQEAGA